MSQTGYLQNSSKTFKIRKTRAKMLQEVQDRQEVQNLQDIDVTRMKQQEKTLKSRIQNQKPQIQIQAKTYMDDEQQINCYRFPHSKFCGCESNCLLESFDPIQILPNLYFGSYMTGLKAKHLLELGITHVLNVTSKTYTKRQHYFNYLNIDLHYNTEEDAKKFFRLSNRFIKNAISQGGKVFIHSSVLELGAIMAVGYLIGIQKISFKQALQKTATNGIQISPHFLKQLESYDLEKMAFVSISRA